MTGRRKPAQVTGRMIVRSRPGAHSGGAAETSVPDRGDAGVNASQDLNKL